MTILLMIQLLWAYEASTVYKWESPIFLWG